MLQLWLSWLMYRGIFRAIARAVERVKWSRLLKVQIRQHPESRIAIYTSDGDSLGWGLLTTGAPNASQATVAIPFGWLRKATEVDFGDGTRTAEVEFYFGANYEPVMQGRKVVLKRRGRD